MDDYSFRRTAGHLTFLVAILAALMALMVWVPRAHAQQVNESVTPIVTATAAASLVLKATPGRLYSVYATNNTATAGYLLILNAVSDPTSGTVAPLACVPLPASGAASINYIPTPAGQYSVGITAVLTSASSCYTVTEGSITGFIAGTVK